MGRPKLKEKEKKIQLGITISREMHQQLDKATGNMSGYIQKLLEEHFKEKIAS